MNLGKSLRMAMTKKEVKNKDLAEHLGVEPSVIAAWRHGHSGISWDNVLRICTQLEIKVSEFVALGED